jgi:hypothetical protein
VTVGWGEYSSSNTNPKGKSLFAEGEMSFGIANCSDLLQKWQKSDEYEVFCFAAQSGFGAQATEDPAKGGG